MDEGAPAVAAAAAGSPGPAAPCPAAALPRAASPCDPVRDGGFPLEPDLIRACVMGHWAAHPARGAAPPPAGVPASAAAAAAEAAATASGVTVWPELGPGAAPGVGREWCVLSGPAKSLDLPPPGRAPGPGPTHGPAAARWANPELSATVARPGLGPDPAAARGKTAPPRAAALCPSSPSLGLSCCGGCGGGGRGCERGCGATWDPEVDLRAWPLEEDSFREGGSGALGTGDTWAWPRPTWTLGWAMPGCPCSAVPMLRPPEGALAAVANWARPGRERVEGGSGRVRLRGRAGGVAFGRTQSKEKRRKETVALE